MIGCDSIGVIAQHLEGTESSMIYLIFTEYPFPSFRGDRKAFVFVCCYSSFICRSNGHIDTYQPLTAPFPGLDVNLGDLGFVADIARISAQAWTWLFDDRQRDSGGSSVQAPIVL